MYAHIKGILTEMAPCEVTLETQGIGFRLLTPLSLFSKLPPIGSSVLLYTSFIVREDGHYLYGFLSKADKILFEELIAVSGVGPKTALALIGHMAASDLEQAIQEKNITLLCKIPGIGKKTAERMIVDLKDKFKKKLMHSDTLNRSTERNVTLIEEDALSALLNLGYASVQAQKALSHVLDRSQKEIGLAELITSALRVIK
jgi:Holliday junction DNA helicase RuvA